MNATPHPFFFLVRRAESVIEALPYLRRFNQKIIVVKCGGTAMEDAAVRDKFIQDIVLLKFAGMHPVLVHGGGSEINRELEKRGVKPTFIQGLRVTDERTIKVVHRVLGEKINRGLVRHIEAHGGKPIGLYGKKGSLIRARKLWLKDAEGNPLDLGFTGEVEKIRKRFLLKLVHRGKIPVITSLGVGKRGKLYNINADTAATDIAIQLGAAKLVLMTDVRGVLGRDGKLLSQVNARRAAAMIRHGSISGGMIPKIRNGLKAIKNGVEKVHIIDGRIPHALLLEIFTDQGIGTMVVKG